MDKTERDSKWRPETAQILITNGGKHAVYNSCAVLIDPGDEVLLPAPYWTTYPEAIALAGGTTVEVPTSIDSEFKVTVEQLKQLPHHRQKPLFRFTLKSNRSGLLS